MEDKSIVVANSTPLILLEKIGYIDLLKKLYSKIYIAEAVYQEVIVDGSNRTDGRDFVSQNDWIEIAKIRNIEAKTMFTTSLHSGEVETMILAMELPANLCILDDLLARKYAKSFNLDITGTLGVVVASKNKGYIKEARPLLDKLLNIGMYISNSLYSNTLSLVNEN